MTRGKHDWNRAKNVPQFNFNVWISRLPWFPLEESKLLRKALLNTRFRLQPHLTVTYDRRLFVAVMKHLPHHVARDRLHWCKVFLRWTHKPVEVVAVAAARRQRSAELHTVNQYFDFFFFFSFFLKGLIFVSIFNDLQFKFSSHFISHADCCDTGIYKSSNQKYYVLTCSRKQYNVTIQFLDSDTDFILSTCLRLHFKTSGIIENAPFYLHVRGV